MSYIQRTERNLREGQMAYIDLISGLSPRVLNSNPDESGNSPGAPRTTEKENKLSQEFKTKKKDGY